ncbi:winged helix-turn-helix domain-containing protein [uncultured Granulicatella sp.]|uniref:ArsR/SmtB family transcription factor n=1 Tax=uncultured Granulicatella sp. TaxID=316089 RepID=UPI0028E357FC|nr:winged helix-turn-helix domain-containing protein [uncultured Granulicatella sp.]
MQFKQEQMEFVNQLLYPILILKKNRDEERPSTQLEQQLEDIVEEMRHMSVPLETYMDKILYFYKDDVLRMFFINVKTLLRYRSFDEYVEFLQSMDEVLIKKQLMTSIVKQDEEELVVEDKVEELVGNQFAFLDFLKYLPIDDTLRWNYFTIMSQPKKFVEDFISLHQTIKPIFDKVYAEYLPILEKSYTEFEATIREHPTILAEAFTGTKEIKEIDWTSDDISVIPTLLLSDFFFQDSEILLLGAKSLEVIQHFIQTRLDKQQERINVFKNLGDKTRYQIFCEIAKGTKSVKKIAEQLGITSATVSYHINELVLSNLVVQGWNKKDCLKAIHTELITEVMNGLMEDSLMTNTVENEE